jgi:hypothetical protein
VTSPGSFAGEAYGEIREAIRRSLERRDPLIVITGESGTGKTTLCRSVLEEASGAASSTIVNPFLTFRDLLRQIADDLDPASRKAAEADVDLLATEHDLIRSIQRFVESNPGRLAVVLIDDAHLLNPVVLARLRGLLNLSSTGRGLTILLVGQPELDATLRRPEFLSVAQRVAQRYRLDKPTKAEAPAARRGRARRPVVARRLAGAAALLVAGWIVGDVWRRAFPSATVPAAERGRTEPSAPSVPPATPSASPAPGARPAAVERDIPASPPPPPSEPAARGSGRQAQPLREEPRNADGIDYRYVSLRENVERQAQILASRGQVKALLALRVDAENRYRQLGPSRPAFLAQLLEALDAKIEEARAVRLKLDAQAFRR